MSSLPSQEGVKVLREAAAEFARRGDEAERLHAQIKALTERLDHVLEVKNAAHRNIIEQLKKMDCASNGNYGWEGRIAWMLGEMAVQAEEFGRSHP